MISRSRDLDEFRHASLVAQEPLRMTAYAGRYVNFNDLLKRDEYLIAVCQLR